MKVALRDNGVLEREIYADIRPDSAQVPLPRDRFGMPAEGFVKLSLECDDLAGLSDALEKSGVEFVVSIKPSDRKPGRSWFMVEDPDGNLIQIFGATP